MAVLIARAPKPAKHVTVQILPIGIASMRHAPPVMAIIGYATPHGAM